jgi:flavorubredoxin
MSEAFRALEIADRVYWVGAIDWDLRSFHGYLTGRGSTYNAFLILDEQITLIDAVKAEFYDEMMSRISTLIDPSAIRIVVSNHAELDHSGSLPRLMHTVRPERLLASPKGAAALQAHFHWDEAVETVRSGDRIRLGSSTLRFLETPMLHWPDSMCAFLEEAGLLFSNDIFGMHLASAERFADELDPSVTRYEAAKYYGNILLHLSPAVNALLDKLPGLDLDIQMIVPDHGPIWRERPEQILEQYAIWAAQRPTTKALVIYDTMWESTARMARAVVDGLVEGGASAKMMSLDVSHRSDVATELLEAGALLVGSPTMNNQIYPSVADLMTYLRGLKPRNRIGATFGSYGWSGEAVRHLDQLMQDMKIELVQKGIRVQYAPDEDDLARCHALGVRVAQTLKQRAGAGVSAGL